MGKVSSGVEIFKGLLSGGAHVLIPTSRYSCASVEYYEGILERFGSKGLALTVVPLDQNSKQDVEALDYVYSTLASISTTFHGLFGNDGMYSESQISPEILFSLFNSESWGEYLCLAGAVIR